MDSFNVTISESVPNIIEITAESGEKEPTTTIVYEDASPIIDIDHNISIDVLSIIPVKNILAGSGIGVNSNNGDFTISVTGTFGLTGEEVDDRVNDLLKTGSYINLSYDDSNNSLTISVTGLQPSGNYSTVGHSHTASQITDFDTSVSGLIPVKNIISGSYISISSLSGDYTINATGLQPSGNYSVIGHSHLSSDITDFSNSVNNLVSGVYAPLYSPTFSGIPTVPTATSGTNTLQIASTQFVRSEISNLINSAPSTLDTLNELAAALGNDPNFATTIVSGLAQKSNIGHTHTHNEITDFDNSVSGLLPITKINSGSYIDIVQSGTIYIISSTGLQPSGNYSSVGHFHTSSDITNFNTSISGLLPLVSGTGYVNSSFNNNIYLISVTGLQPSGNYSTVGHSHSVSDITNFNNGVSGLLPYVNGSGNIISSFNNNIYTISTTGLQPSGNYSIVGHSHNTSEIIDFNSSVSGLLPVKNIVAGSGININNTSGNFIIAVTGDFGLTSEQVDDRVSNLLVAGTGIQLNYDDNNNSLTINSRDEILEYNNSSYFPISGDINYLYRSNDTSRLYQWTGSEYVELGPSSSLYGLNISSSSIFDFNSSVSGLLPSITGVSYVTSSLNNNIYSISVTGLQPSGDYANTTHTHTSSDISNFNSSVSGLLPSINGSGYIVSSLINNSYYLSATGLQPSGNYSLVGHNHTSSNITNFNTSVSGLLPAINGSGYVVSSLTNNIYNISVTGLQPSGNYANASHTHTSSQITDFNSSVSGLLPVKNILGSGNINVSNSNGSFTISNSGLIKSDTTGINGATAVLNIIQISQANYDALGSYDPNTLYVIN